MNISSVQFSRASNCCSPIIHSTPGWCEHQAVHKPAVQESFSVPGDETPSHSEGELPWQEPLQETEAQPASDPSGAQTATSHRDMAAL